MPNYCAHAICRTAQMCRYVALGIDYRLPFCDECGGEHAAEYSHQGEWGQGAIYSVVCTGTDEWLTGYYTSEVIEEIAR